MAAQSPPPPPPPPPQKPTRRRAAACFFHCFECSDDESRLNPRSSSSSGKKMRRWFPLPRSRSRSFRMVKNSTAKTVPVENNATPATIDSSVESEKKEANDRFNSSKSKSKPKSKKQKWEENDGGSELLGGSAKNKGRAVTQPQTQALATETVPAKQPPKSDSAPETKHVDARHGHQDDATQDGKRRDRTDSAQAHAHLDQRRLSFRRKIDAIRTRSGQAGSPDIAPRSASSSAAAAVPRSVSSLPPALNRETTQPPQVEAPPPPVEPKQKMKKTPAMKIAPQENGSGQTKRLDPVVGMSIILVILMILVLWGRLCAILCTAVWFYFIPRLMSAVVRDDPARNPRKLDLDSEEYKKKVVLEGFLERNRRSSS